MQISQNVNALQSIGQAFNTNAAEIASITTDSIENSATGSDLTQNMVNLITLPAAQEANVQAIRSADEMMGSLLDIKV